MLAAVEFNGERALFLGLAAAAALLVIIVQARGASQGEATLPAASLPVPVVRKSTSGRAGKSKPEAGMKNSSKGIIVAIIGGLALGGVFPPLRSSLFGQFGLGAYAGLVLFASGVLTATLFLNLYFMNFPVQGGSVGLSAYLRGKVGQHLLGIVGGALCAAGVLALSLLNAFPADVQPSSWALSAAALGAGVLALGLGISVWRELAQSPGSVMRSVLIGALFVLVAIGSFALAMEKVPAPPQAPQQIGVLPHTQFPG
jgi:glucose uptake protein